MTDLTPDISAIRQDLAFFTARWGELDVKAKFEIRVLGPSGATSGFFGADDLDAAAAFAAELNGLKRNVYMTRNPLRYEITETAKDEDVIAAFFAWADCDDAASVANVRSYGGPGHAATVLTGRVPSLRAHTYWELEEPCLNLDAWRGVQRGIAARFASDRAVINPSRIMRVAGCVSWPSDAKRRKGYMPELVGLRTEFDDDRDAISFETMTAEFPEAAADAVGGGGADAGGGRAAGKTALDRAMATANIREGNNWHDNIVRLIASYVMRDLGDEEIHAITDVFTSTGYTVEQTRREVQTAIEGARRKRASGTWGSRRSRRAYAPASAEPGPRPDSARDGADSPAEPGAAERDENAEAREQAVMECVTLPLNDYGNACRLIRHFGDDMLFVPRRGWFSWDGVRWVPDEDELLVRRTAHKIAPLILEEAMYLPISRPQQEALDLAYSTADRLDELAEKGAKGRSAVETAEYHKLTAIAGKAEEIEALKENARKTRRRHAKNAGNTGPVSNMLGEAKPHIYRTIDALDADPMLVNTQSGTLVFTFIPKGDQPGDDAFADVTCRPHDRSDVISKVVLSPYDPKAEAPVFTTFMRRIQPDEKMREFLQRWFGYTLLGLNSEQKLVFFHGGGRNGKSTLVDVIAKILGEYATSLPIETLTGSDQRSGADATPDLVRVVGARMVRASEPEEGMKFKEAMIKLITGGEPIMIRKMREEFIEVDPIFKLTISGNHKPNVRGTDDGIWRRLLLVPFLEQIPKDQIDPTLPQKLWDERAGILNWLVEGAREYLEIGLNEPAAVLDATAEFREDSDPVRQFIDSWCEVTGDANDFESAKEMADAMRLFQKINSMPEWGVKRIGNDLVAKSDGGYRTPEGKAFGRKKASTYFYTGIRLTAEARRKLDESDERNFKSSRRD